jgi:hypothetical protein
MGLLNIRMETLYPRDLSPVSVNVDINTFTMADILMVIQ